jgi:oligopeptidase A
MALHHHFEPQGSTTPFDVQQRVAALTTVLPPLPEDRFLCSFGHIFAGGYAAGYYSYKWAEVLSADAFAAFEEAGLDNAAALAATGQRYRNSILALGGSRPPMEVFHAFRGREPTTAALLRHSGLAA